MMFSWVPGTNVSDEIINRMRSHFPRPEIPMGEAWFMGEKRKMYTDLVNSPLSKLSCEYLQNALYEITSGKGFDEETEREEWRPWFRYLLPELILRSYESHVDYLLESLITAFIAIFGQSPDKEYEGFHRDAVSSLGIALMNPGLWRSSKVVPNDPNKSAPCFLLEEINESKLRIEWVGFGSASQPLSSALFLCLKYLSPADMPSWIDSILSIEHPHWRFAILVWLIGAQGLLAEGNYKALSDAVPEITWANTFLLEKSGEPLLSKENIEAFNRQLQSRFTHKLIDEWHDQFRADSRISRITGVTWVYARAQRLCTSS